MTTKPKPKRKPEIIYLRVGQGALVPADGYARQQAKPCIKCGATDRYVNGKCRPCAKAWKIANYASCPGKDNERTKKWHLENPEKARIARAARYAKNPEKVNIRNKKWNLANPASKRIQNHNRRARVNRKNVRLSKGIIEKLYKLQRGKCACCGKPLGDNYHLDHIMPLALGGENEDLNMQLLTKLCNLQKSAKHPTKFMQERGFLL